MSIWSKPDRQPANDHLRLADVDTRIDEWAAMREVYEALRAFDEPAQRRIVAAVKQRLDDELAARRFAADHDEHTLDVIAARDL